MKYRKLGRTGIEVSEIGLGLEHLLDKEQSVVTETIRSAVQGGVNYFDCLSQKGFAGESGGNEDFIKLGNALKGYRDKVYITYIASSALSVDVTEHVFRDFLKGVGTDYADVFIIACCDRIADYEKLTEGNGLLAYAKKLQADKKIGFIGFSTHSSNVAFKVINNGNFDVLMYPVNPAFDVVTNEEDYISDDLGKLWDAAYDYSTDEKNGAELIRKSVFSECARKQIGLVAMKPFAGGWLFGKNVNTGFTPVNLVSYALSQNGVSTVIPGCSESREIEEILSYHTCDNGKRDYSRAVSESRWSIKGNCMYCNHCLPCAMDIDIAKVNRLADSVQYSDFSDVLSKYNLLTAKASSCIKCGECETRCPFKVEIMKKMEATAELFER